MLRESSYADLTVRAVAARAKVAPATAYTYFSSKNHLIAEVYLDLIRQVPYFTDVNDSRLTRVEKALRSMALMVADEPEVAAACTTALLTRQRPDGAHASATASAPRSTAASARPSARTPTRARCRRLEMTFFGALVNAGSGAFTYHQIADRLSYVVGLILGEDRHMTRSR